MVDILKSCFQDIFSYWLEFYYTQVSKLYTKVYYTQVSKTNKLEDIAEINYVKNHLLDKKLLANVKCKQKELKTIIKQLRKK